MNMLTKQIPFAFRFIIVLSLLCFVNKQIAFAEEEADKKTIFSYNAGIKGYYLTGVSPDNFYYKPFADMTIAVANLKITPSFARYQHYQLANATGSFFIINYNQPGCSVGADITDELTITGGYKYSFGDLSYRGNEFSGDISYDNGKYSLNAESFFRENRFVADSSKIKINNYDINAEFGYYFTESASLDLSYDRNVLSYGNVNTRYITNIFRVGVTPSLSKSVILITGVSAGVDNDRYRIVGADAALTLKAQKNVKFTVMDMASYYMPPSGAITNKTKGSSNARSKNPLLKSSLLGKAYLSNIFSFGATLMF